MDLINDINQTKWERGKTAPISIILAFLLLAGLSETGRAQVVEMSTAQKVAEHWINVIIQKKGGWGDAPTAHVTSIEEFKHTNRILGYFCRVEPIGFILISLRKELAPVKAYSANSDIDPHTECADLLKERMERILDLIEERIGPVMSARSEDVSSMFEVDYRPMWDALEAGIPTLEKPAELAESKVEGAYVEPGNYQEGDELIKARWRQVHPYNKFCPEPPTGSTCTEDHCTVGCNATAGAQVLHYWCWPPYGVGHPYDNEYQWSDMPNELSENSTQEEIDAVAELSYEVGAERSNYCSSGCSTSSHIKYMRPGYIDHFRYNSGCWIAYRENYTSTSWFNLIITQLNKNRPMTYGIPGHAVVCDGWDKTTIPPLNMDKVHINWGNGNCSQTTWYTIDHISNDKSKEHLLTDHYPVQSVGSTVVSGTYPKNALPYWYFDQDATAPFTTTFASGNYLQFLPGIRLRSTGNVRIESTATDNTRIFSRGDPSKGIRMRNGTIVLQSGGCMKFTKQ